AGSRTSPPDGPPRARSVVGVHEVAVQLDADVAQAEPELLLDGVQPRPDQVVEDRPPQVVWQGHDPAGALVADVDVGLRGRVVASRAVLARAGDPLNQAGGTE